MKHPSCYPEQGSIEIPVEEETNRRRRSGAEVSQHDEHGATIGPPDA